MACFGQDGAEPVAGTCADCGADVDADGDAVENCYYSPTVCETCNHSPCDLSC